MDIENTAAMTIQKKASNPERKDATSTNAGVSESQTDESRDKGYKFKNERHHVIGTMMKAELGPKDTGLNDMQIVLNRPKEAETHRVNIAKEDDKMFCKDGDVGENVSRQRGKKTGIM